MFAFSGGEKEGGVVGGKHGLEQYITHNTPRKHNTPVAIDYA